jgi:hypothetical protein
MKVFLRPIFSIKPQDIVSSLPLKKLMIIFNMNEIHGHHKST